MCNKSDSIAKIAGALVAFSGEVKSIEKDAVNPHFKSNYTSLDHMIDETKPLLNKHGLTVMQFPGGDGEKITIRTMILHTSGEYIESEPLTLKAVKTDPQGAGSAITYGRRYSYAAALSLSLGDDDDGNGASQPPRGTQQSTPTNTQPSQQNAPTTSQNGVKMISDPQVGLVKKLVKEKQVSDEQYRQMIAPKTGTKDLTSQEASKLIETLNKLEVVIDINQDDLPF